MAEQLALGLPHREALGRDDFLAADSNAAALRLIDEWPHWPTHAAVLVGPNGSGKTHLAAVWQARSHAKLLPAKDLMKDNVPDHLAGNALCLEDVQPGGFDEVALFHLLNAARQQGAHVLMTSAVDPTGWNVKLPDLTSRIKALPSVSILPPDDALLRGVLVKLFTDRQIAVDEALISYLTLRMPRSLSAAGELVAEIDRAAMAEKAEVTRPFVARILLRMDSPNLFTT
jgi:chromosomal replication initiation ATPase DnaA